MDRWDLGLYMYKLDLHKSIQGSLEKKAVVWSIDQGVKIMNSYSGTKSASGVVKHGAGDWVDREMNTDVTWNCGQAVEQVSKIWNSEDKFSIHIRGGCATCGWDSHHIIVGAVKAYCYTGNALPLAASWAVSGGGTADLATDSDAIRLGMGKGIIWWGTQKEEGDEAKGRATVVIIIIITTHVT